MGAPSPAQVLSVERIPGEGAVYIRLTGTINETFDARRFGELDPVAVLDLGAVRSITSFGVRRWCEFVAAVPPTAQLYLLDCPPCVVDQINLVLNFCGRAEVLSARAPYFCPSCQKEVEVRFDLLNEAEMARSARAADQHCPTCGTVMEGETEYLRFAPRHAAKRLDRSAARILGLLQVYTGTASESRPLEVHKLVEDSVTLIRLSGTIDAKFRPRRLLEGVEGTAVVLLGGASVSDEGVARWNDFHTTLSSQASDVVLVDVPFTLLELADRSQVDLGKSVVHSVQLSFFCAHCSEIQSHPLVLAQLGHSLPSGGPCQRCGRETSPIEGMVSVEALRARVAPTPAAAADVIERCGELFSTAHVEAAVTADADNQVGGKSQIGGYRIIKPLSSGGMAQVFLASRSSLGGFEKPVALKLFRRSLIETSRTSLGMFLREAKICARLSHPNIVQIFDVGEAGGDLYMAMEYIDGRDVMTVLDKNGSALPIGVVLHIVEKVLEALDYAHNARDLTGTPLDLVHRDVSLQNVLVNFDGWVKLIDFGIAVSGESRLSTEVAGNVCYMSPEQCSGKRLDGRSDLFSLGVVMWEALSGQHLFRRSTIEQTLSAMLTADIPPLDDVPAELMALVQRALQRDVEDRWQSAAQMLEAVRGLAAACGPVYDARQLSTYMRQLFPQATTTEKIPTVAPYAATMLQPVPTSLPPAAARPTPTVRAAVESSLPALGGAARRTMQREAVPSEPENPTAASVAAAPPATARPGSSLAPWLLVGALLFLLVVGATLWLLLVP